MEYNKQYGKFELIRQFNQFLAQQEAILERYEERGQTDEE
jgi:hypothetical protein